MKKLLPSGTAPSESLTFRTEIVTCWSDPSWKRSMRFEEPTPCTPGCVKLVVNGSHAESIVLEKSVLIPGLSRFTCNMAADFAQIAVILPSTLKVWLQVPSSVGRKLAPSGQPQSNTPLSQKQLQPVAWYPVGQLAVWRPDPAASFQIVLRKLLEHTATALTVEPTQLTVMSHEPKHETRHVLPLEHCTALTKPRASEFKFKLVGPAANVPVGQRAHCDHTWSENGESAPGVLTRSD